MLGPDDEDSKKQFDIPSPTYYVVPCGSGKAFGDWPAPVDNPALGFRGQSPVCLFEEDHESGLAMLGWADKDYWQVAKAKLLFGDALVIRKVSLWARMVHKISIKNGKLPSHLNFQDNSPHPYMVMMMNYTDLRKPLTQEQRDLLAECAPLQKGLHRRGYEIDKSYDVMITALGFVYDDTPFKNGNVRIDRKGLFLGSNPDRSRPDYYPSLTPAHASTSADNVFFIGANSHGLDRERYKAAGGFIHGYRHTTRAVFRTLMAVYEKNKLLGKSLQVVPPAETPRALSVKDILEQPLWKKLMERLVFGAASYGMVGGSLIDGIVFGGAAATKCMYVEETPEDLFHASFSIAKRLTFGFYAGGEVSPVGGELFGSMRLTEQAAESDAFHVVLEYWPVNPKLRDLGRACALCFVWC